MLRGSAALSVQQLLAAATGTIPEQLSGLSAGLAHCGRPGSTMRWLLKPIPRALLKTIGGEMSITHASLDACPSGHARHHLRSLLIDAGILPIRDEHTERLGTWVDELVATLPPHPAAVIGPYAHWKVLRTVRRRTRRKQTPIGVAGSARERIRTAVRLLSHLDQMGVGIAVLTQDTLDRWTNGNRSRSSDIAPFVRWLNISGVAHGLRVEVQRMADPREINPGNLHYTLIHELISGSTSADLATRVAGLLILLYGARTDGIHMLTTADINKAEGQYADQNGKGQLPLRLATRTPRAHPPHHARSELALARIRPQITHNSAMLALASDLPAAVVATQMGLTAQTTSRWAQFAQRDNVEYILAHTNP